VQDGVGGEHHAPAALAPGKRPGTHCTGGWVGPRAGLDGCGKSRPQSGFDPRTVQPVATYQEYFLGGKGGRCVRLTTLPPLCAYCHETWEPQPRGTLRACPGLWWDCSTLPLQLISIIVTQGVKKVSVYLMITGYYSNNPHTIDDLKMAITEYIRNADRAILNTVFENTVRRLINVWRLAGVTLNITCSFVYCNHQVHRLFDHPVWRCTWMI
jgi:hypothetical protein